MATSAPGGGNSHTLTRRSVADVQGTLLLAVAVLPLKHSTTTGGRIARQL